MTISHNLSGAAPSPTGTRPHELYLLPTLPRRPQGAEYGWKYRENLFIKVVSREIHNLPFLHLVNLTSCKLEAILIKLTSHLTLSPRGIVYPDLPIGAQREHALSQPITQSSPTESINVVRLLFIYKTQKTTLHITPPRM